MEIITNILATIVGIGFCISWCKTKI